MTEVCSFFNFCIRALFIGGDDDDDDDDDEDDDDDGSEEVDDEEETVTEAEPELIFGIEKAVLIRLVVMSMFILCRL